MTESQSTWGAGATKTVQGPKGCGGSTGIVCDTGGGQHEASTCLSSWSADPARRLKHDMEAEMGLSICFRRSPLAAPCRMYRRSKTRVKESSEWLLVRLKTGPMALVMWMARGRSLPFPVVRRMLGLNPALPLHGYGLQVPTSQHHCEEYVRK